MSDLFAGDKTTIRILRTMNAAAMGWMLFSNAVFAWRKQRKARNQLEIVATVAMLAAFICVFMVTINIVFLPLFDAPPSVFACNLFERSGNITHFVMFTMMPYFFYLRAEVIRKTLMSKTFLKTVMFGRACKVVVAGLMLGFILTCVYIESFPLNDANACFFGVPPFVGSLVISCLFTSGTAFLLLFTYILKTEATMTPDLRSKVIECWVATAVSFACEFLCFVVFDKIFAPEIWNMILHIDITINMFLLTTNLSSWKRRLMQNPFKADNDYMTQSRQSGKAGTVGSTVALKDAIASKSSIASKAGAVSATAIGPTSQG
ncbi:unnamed protein product (mitochondrion) [Plasmodiophora brassicae]|uniref:Uncharacterized protein n=1 Tax=Plasmodiophora brassicae TaxID=37360 RepID=A0A0G4ISP0_PLABS|nr:hypothetical protein PBRA_006399 [Plasmodiophora brassicae]SPQ95140.1 unnamed protein product [Plasmodiophora brassicae]